MPGSYYFDLGNVAEIGARNPSVYDQVDLMSQQQGNPYLVNNMGN